MLLARTIHETPTGSGTALFKMQVHGQSTPSHIGHLINL